MKSLLKWIFGIVLSVVVLVGIGIGLLLFVVDPNNYKPQIEQLAKDNGINLQINGELSWQLLPNIAITVGDTSLNGNNLPEVQFQQADLALDLGKLIGGDIAVNKIAISQPVIRLETSDTNAAEQAVAIAAAPLTAAQVAAAQQPAAATNSDSMTLAIKSMEVHNGTLVLLENGTVQQRIEHINITSQQVNLSQQPFPFSLELSTSVADIAEQLSLGLSAQITTDNTLQKVSVANGALNIAIESSTYGNHQLNAQLATTIDLIEDMLDLPTTTVNLDSIPLQLSARVISLTDTPDIQGIVEIPLFEPQPLLTSFGIDPSAVPVKNLALKTQFSSKGSTHRLADLELAMDDFILTGNVAATLAEQHHINATLNGTALNLDRYMPAGEASSIDQQPTALFAPLLAPLAALNGGKGQVEITLAQLITQGVQLDNVHLNAFGNGSVIRIADAAANGFGGSLKSDARIDLSSTTPKLTFNLAASAVDIGSALTTLADFKELSGHGDLNFKGSSQGNSSDGIIARLNGSGNFQLTEPQYSAINIEQQFCKVAGEKSSQPESWPTDSRFDNVQGVFTLSGQTLTFQRLNTSVGNLQLKGTGGMELLDGLLDMTMTFNISDPKSSEQGCTLRSQSIRNRDIPIHLNGHVDNMNGMITNGLVKLVTKLAIERKRDKLLDKLLGSDKDGQQQKEPDSEQPKDSQEKDSKEQIKDLLKDLLKKR